MNLEAYYEDFRAFRCAFRRIRPPVPTEIGHLFRPKSAACSD